MAFRSPSMMSVKYCCGRKVNWVRSRYSVRARAKSWMNSTKKVSRSCLKSWSWSIAVGASGAIDGVMISDKGLRGDPKLCWSDFW